MSADSRNNNLLSTAPKDDKLGQELFDIKAILNKVENGNTTEPDIPTKSSTEILSELFEAFNAEPPKIPDRKEQVSGNGASNEGQKEVHDDNESNIKSKKNKKSKKKHKHKEKKHKKKSKSSKKQESSDDSDDGRKKHKHVSDRKKKKRTEVQVKENEVKIMPTMEPVSVMITTDGDNVKRTVECAVNEDAPPKVSVKSEEPATKPLEEVKANTQVKEEAVPVTTITTTQAKPASDVKAKPGKIVIKNLKFSSVFEETVRQVEEQAKLKAERYEEGEISEDSSENKEETPLDDDTLELTPERDNNPDKKERRKHCRKHSTEEKCHRHHHHRHHHKSRSRSVERKGESPVKDPSGQHGRECSHSKKTSEKNHNQCDDARKHRSSSVDSHRKKRSHSRDSGSGSKKRSRRSHSRHNSVSKDKSKCSKHSRSKRRSESQDRSNKSKHSKRSRSRSHSRHRSGSDGHSERSKRSKRSRSHSRSRRRSESTSRSDKKHSRHSRSHSRSRRRSESTSRSDKSKRLKRSRSRDSAGHIDKQKLLEIARKNAMNLLKQGVLPSSVVTQDKVVAIKAGGKSVAELTDFCKQLSKKEALGQVSSDSEGEEHHSSGSDTERPFHHPFQIKERPSSIVMNIRNSVQLPLKTLQEKTAEQSKQLRIQFPVSSGQQHRKTENEWVPVSPKKEEPSVQVAAKVAETKPVAETTNQVFPAIVNTEGLDIGSIVSQRLTAMRKLQENPNDVQALTEMYRAQKDMQMWAESKQQPGQFTGSTGARVLSAAELSSGFQAWVKKDQLTTASPVSGGMGMALLQKMGWRPGEGLGKNKEGTLEPLKLEIKMDKKGLVSQEELGRRPVPPVPQNPTTKTLVGKHPVSLLVEFCSKRRWGVPQFDLCFECGPDHRKNFLFKVRVDGNEYKPSVASPNKKQAKAEAATICLQALGVLPP